MERAHQRAWTHCDPNKNGPWYDCVAVQTGNPTKVARGFEARIAREGACDTRRRRHRELRGDRHRSRSIPAIRPRASTSRVTAIRTPNGDQISPRLVTIFILEDPPTGLGQHRLPDLRLRRLLHRADARTTDDIVDEADLDPFCEMPGGGNVRPRPSAVGRAVRRASRSTIECGHTAVAACTPIADVHADGNEDADPDAIRRGNHHARTRQPQRRRQRWRRRRRWWQRTHPRLRAVCELDLRGPRGGPADRRDDDLQHLTGGVSRAGEKTMSSIAASVRPGAHEPVAPDRRRWRWR